MLTKKPFEDLKVGEDPIRSIGDSLQEICRGKNIEPIDLTQGNPIGPISKEYSYIMRELIQQEQLGGSLSNSYTASIGHPDFLKAACGLENKMNKINISPDHVLAVPGAAEGISTLLCGLREQEKSGEVILLTPFFPLYKAYTKYFGFTPKIVEFRPTENLILDEIEKAINNHTRAIIINSPNNPSGHIYSKSFLRDLGNILRIKDCVLAISDEPYRKIILPDRKMISVIDSLNYRNTSVVYSFSKEGRMAGCRIGYIALHPEFPNHKNVRNALANTLTQRGIVQAPTREQFALSRCNLPLDVDWSDTLRLMKNYSSELTQMGYEILEPQGGIFMCVKSPSGNGTEFHQKLLNRGIGVVPGTPFGIPEYIRMSLCGDARKIDEVLKRFEHIKRGYQGVTKK